MIVAELRDGLEQLWRVAGVLAIAVGIVVGALLWARYGAILGLPAMIGLSALTLSTQVHGREVHGPSKQHRAPSAVALPPTTARRLVELDMLREELELDRDDLDALRRLGFWLDHHQQLPELEREWLRARGAELGSIASGLHRVLNLDEGNSTRRLRRDAHRQLLAAMRGFRARATTHSGRGHDPYRR